MSKPTTPNPRATALGVSLAVALANISLAAAQDNPFTLTTSSGSYQVAADTGGTMAPAMPGTSSGGTAGGMGKHAGGMGMHMMDANGDGKITKDEFMQGHDKMFSRLDANGDGTISKEEFDKAHEAMFARLDANKDGVLERGERRKMMEGPGGADTGMPTH